MRMLYLGSRIRESLQTACRYHFCSFGCVWERKQSCERESAHIDHFCSFECVCETSERVSEKNHFCFVDACVWERKQSYDFYCFGCGRDLREWVRKIMALYFFKSTATATASASPSVLPLLPQFRRLLPQFHRFTSKPDVSRYYFKIPVGLIWKVDLFLKMIIWDEGNRFRLAKWPVNQAHPNICLNSRSDPSPILLGKAVGITSW